MLSTTSKNLFKELLALSKENFNKDKIPISAIIFDYQTKKIISKASNNDSPIGHAELIVIEKALKIKKTNRLNDCDIYVSIEPCAMCATAIAKCHIRRLYFGAEDEKSGGVINGAKVYQTSKLKTPEIISHCFEKETASILKKFFEDKRK